VATYPDLEAIELAGRWRRMGLDIVDICAWRPRLQVLLQFIHRIRRAFSDDADVPRRVVRDPADQAQPLRATLNEPAEADALYSPPDGRLETCCLSHRRRVADSGRFASAGTHVGPGKQQRIKTELRVGVGVESLARCAEPGEK
jgi:hypothetical protein